MNPDEAYHYLRIDYENVTGLLGEIVERGKGPLTGEDAYDFVKMAKEVLKKIGEL